MISKRESALRRPTFSHAVLGLALLASLPVQALSPSEVFEKVSPSVWAVRSLDASERPIGYGSGVVIGPGRMVTNCHVLAKAKGVQVRRENVSYEATLEAADPERDLCILALKNFAAPSVQVRPLAETKIGQRVYAVGNPEGLALTLSEGLISGLRSEDPRIPPVQTSAPISPGSSGGGLFDDEGRLIAITTLIYLGSRRIAQNLNFAMPADWIADVPARAAELLAKRRGSAGGATSSGTGSPLLPVAGTVYRYAWSDRQYQRREEFSVRVASVDGWTVSETARVSTDGEHATATIQARDLSFVPRRIAEGRSLLELAPYLPIERESGVDIQVAPPFPADGYGGWTVALRNRDWEEIAVPAGTFRAFRITVTGTRRTLAGSAHTIAAVAERFEYSVWYAPEVKRYLRIRHRVWNMMDSPIGDDEIQLVEFSRK